MGRIQSSIGLITGTDIAGTVDQLIALSGRPRNRLLSRTILLQQEQQAIASLTASVIGVQLAGNNLSNVSAFRTKAAESSNSESLSAVAGTSATPATHVVRTLQTAATHSVRSLQRFNSTEEALGFSGSLSIHPDGFIDSSAKLSELNEGRGVEAGTIRITDRSGTSDLIDLSNARTIDDVLNAINDAEIDVRATTDGNAIKLIDQTGSTDSNLQVEQLGIAETAADLGLWGIDTASNTATGATIDVESGVLHGTALSELAGGSGIGPLTDLDITLSDGSSASIDLSSATTTSEVIDAIDAAGLDLIVRYNDAKNGLQLRDVSGGTGNFSISSADSTADDLGITASTSNDIVVGDNLNRQIVTTDTLLTDLNQGAGISGGSFTITDSDGGIGAVNLTAEGITTVGELIDAINDRGIGVTAALNVAGDGIHIIDNAGGDSTLTIADTGNGTAAADLGIAGTATDQTIGGSLVSALVGTQAGVITVDADDTLETLATKINENGRYGEASVQINDDGTYSLRIRSRLGGEAGRIAINTSGFELDLRTDSHGQDALIAVSTDGGTEQFRTSSDGVFDLANVGGAASLVTSSTPLSDFASVSGGSFTIADSDGVTSAINLTVDEITTAGELIDAINGLGIGVTASINETGSGIAIVDTAEGSETLTITDVGNGTAAASLGIAGTATTQTINGESVSALVGTGSSDATEGGSGLVLTLKELSDSPITITVQDDPDAVKSAAQTFVDQYNLLVDQLDALTAFNAETDEIGLLFGSSEALRIRNGYTRLLSGSLVGGGSFRSIGQVGMRFNEQGKLDLDSGKLADALVSNQADVEAFFTTDETGLVDRLNGLADRIAGDSSSLLINRTQTLSTQIDFNNDRIETFNTRLEKERERLLNQFYATEEAIAKLQANQSAINQIQPINFLTSN